MEIKKLLQGERFTDSKDGKEYFWMGGTVWGLFNDKHQLIEPFTTKRAAQDWKALIEK